MNSKTIAVDFDGTLCEDTWPEIGAPIHSGNPIGVVLYKDDEAITVQLTDEAKHDPQIMKLFGFNQVTSMSFEIKGENKK